MTWCITNFLGLRVEDLRFMAHGLWFMAHNFRYEIQESGKQHRLTKVALSVFHCASDFAMSQNHYLAGEGLSRQGD